MSTVTRDKRTEKLLALRTSKKGAEAAEATGSIKLSGREEVIIPIKCIVPDPNQPREIFLEEKVKRLANSIQKFGLKKAIEVRKVSIPGRPEVLYMIIDGETRWRAHKLINWQTIRAVVNQGNMTNGEAFVDSVISNFHRNDHTPMEIANSIQELRDMGKSEEDLVCIFGRAQSWIEKFSKLLKLSPNSQAKMDPRLPEDERLQFPVAIILSKLPQNMHDEITDKIISDKLSMVEAKTYIGQCAEKKNLKFRGRKSGPDSIVASMRSFLKGTTERLNAFANIPKSTLDKLGVWRSKDELRDLSKQAGDVASGLAKFKKMIDSIESSL